jgi:transposase
MMHRRSMDASLLATLLPVETGMAITSFTVQSQAIVVELAAQRSVAVCPLCRRESGAIHSRYRRILHDRPCLGHPLQFTLAVRKFVCRNNECPRKIFTEPLEGLADPHARSSVELAATHCSIGLALGGEAGARLANKLAIPTSPDTLLRRVKAQSEAPAPPPRYVGLYDWAFRKGQSYATILIDLERGTVIDLLNGRDGEALKVWLAANPQVEVITRDRWPAYIEAATTVAPHARQVADRFHLLRNVREAVEKLLTRHVAEIRVASDAEPASTPAEPMAGPTPPLALDSPTPEAADTPPPKDDPKAAKRRHREDLFRQVKGRHRQGHSARSTARHLGLNIKVVLQYLKRDHCPDWNPGRTAPTGLDAFSQFITDWVGTGGRNSAELFRVLKERGYRGGYDAVRRYLSKVIGSSGRPGRRDDSTTPPRPKAPSARKLSYRLVKPNPGGRSEHVLNRLRTSNASLHEALQLFEELIEMLRRQRTTTLTEWASRALANGTADLVLLAKSFLKDDAAIQAALTTDWSNGPVEGQVNRLKMIKRQMYGRAGMDLLKARVTCKA